MDSSEWDQPELRSRREQIFGQTQQNGHHGTRRHLDTREYVDVNESEEEQAEEEGYFAESRKDEGADDWSTEDPRGMGEEADDELLEKIRGIKTSSGRLHEQSTSHMWDTAARYGSSPKNRKPLQHESNTREDADADVRYYEQPSMFSEKGADVVPEQLAMEKDWRRSDVDEEIYEEERGSFERGFQNTRDEPVLDTFQSMQYTDLYRNEDQESDQYRRNRDGRHELQHDYDRIQQETSGNRLSAGISPRQASYETVEDEQSSFWMPTRVADAWRRRRIEEEDNLDDLTSRSEVLRAPGALHVAQNDSADKRASVAEAIQRRGGLTGHSHGGQTSVFIKMSSGRSVRRLGLQSSEQSPFVSDKQPQFNDDGAEGISTQSFASNKKGGRPVIGKDADVHNYRQDEMPPSPAGTKNMDEDRMTPPASPGEYFSSRTVPFVEWEKRPASRLELTLRCMASETVTRSLPLKNSARVQAILSIDVESEKRQMHSLSVFPTSLRLSPGETATVEIIFTAPSVPLQEIHVLTVRDLSNNRTFQRFRIRTESMSPSPSLSSAQRDRLSPPLLMASHRVINLGDSVDVVAGATFHFKLKNVHPTAQVSISLGVQRANRKGCFDIRRKRGDADVLGPGQEASAVLTLLPSPTDPIPFSYSCVVVVTVTVIGTSKHRVFSISATGTTVNLPSRLL